LGTTLKPANKAMRSVLADLQTGFTTQAVARRVHSFTIDKGRLLQKGDGPCCIRFFFEQRRDRSARDEEPG
jgi:hypothetical protein